MSVFRGRFQLGEDLPVAVLCVNSAGTPAAPDEAPTVDIWSASGQVRSLLVPAMDRPAVTGLFGMRLFLNQDFAAGLYQMFYRYRVAGLANVLEDRFEIVAGGDGNGAVISMYGFRLPFATFLVHQLDSGKIKKGKNPRV